MIDSPASVSRGRRQPAAALRFGLKPALTVAVLFFLATNAACAEEDGDAATARLADGRVLVGPLRSIAGGEVRLGDPSAPFASADVVRLDFRGHAAEPTSRASLIQLANGDRVVAGLTSMSDEAVVALWKAHPDWPPVRIPSEMIAGILLTPPADARDRAQWFARVFDPRAKSDVVLLFNGDSAAGDLVGFDQVNLKLTQAGKPLQIELPRVRGISFNAALSSLPAGKKPRIHVTLTDGSQLTGSAASRDWGGPLRFTTAFLAPLEIPLAAVRSIRFLDGRTTYLSDLEPRRATATGFFGSSERIPLAKDRNVLGGPLAARGTEYPKGLGTRSQSRIEFDLAGRYRRFQAVAVLDDLAQGKGSVRFVVERDGTRVFQSGLVTGTMAPLAVGPLDMTGAKRLALVVDYGELADINDWADWCDAVVIR